MKANGFKVLPLSNFSLKTLSEQEIKRISGLNLCRSAKKSWSGIWLVKSLGNVGLQLSKGVNPFLNWSQSSISVNLFCLSFDSSSTSTVSADLLITSIVVNDVHLFLPSISAFCSFLNIDNSRDFWDWLSAVGKVSEVGLCNKWYEA